MVKLIYGVGFNDGKYPTKFKGEHTKEYRLWRNMLARCYSSSHPTYADCVVSTAFRSYSYFYEWCQSQIGFGQESYHLDKDLLFKGNKLYSESECLFLPKTINVLLTNRVNHRGSSPIGVRTHANGYQSRLNLFGRHHHLGTFTSREEAFQAYKTAKEAHVKHMAELYKADIDPRAYAALMAYQVEITD